MAIENLLPNADGDEQDWDTNAGGGPAHWANVVQDDGDTSYVFIGQTGVNRDEEFHHAATSASSGKTINNLTLFARCSHTSGSGTAVINLGLRVNSLDYQDAAYDKNIIAGPYTLVNHVFTLNPNTGSAWTSTIIDDVQSCFYYKTSPIRNTDIRVTYCYFRIDYSEPTFPKSQIILIS